MEVNNRSQYQERLERFEKTITFQSPDRVPVIPIDVHYFPTNLIGMSKKDATYKYEARFKAWRDMVLKFDFDMAPVSSLFPPQVYEEIGYNLYKWPGNGLPDDTAFQYIEGEYMKAEDFDALLSNPSDYLMRTLWPRLATGLKPMEGLFPLHLGYYNPPFALGSFLATDSSQKMLKSLSRLGILYKKYHEVDIKYTNGLMELRYPIAWGIFGVPSFDLVSEMLRGLQGSMLDLFTIPDKLIKTVDMFTDAQLQSLISTAKFINNPRVAIFSHRGGSSFMSNKQFETYYWPSIKKMILGLLDAGLTPCPFFQGDWTPRLPYLEELPQRKFPIHFDNTDRKGAKKYLRDKFCFWGNISPMILIHGTKQQVKDDVKELIDTFAANGGLIIDGGIEIPDEARPENVTAMIEAAMEYSAQ